MKTIVSQFLLTAPLYLFVLAGYLAVKVLRISPWFRDLFTRVIFAFLIPALLFFLMSDSSRFVHFEWKVLVAFFGGCVLVFAIGQAVARWGLRLQPTERPIFGIGGVFSNNVMLGLPLAQLTLGSGAISTVAMVLVFNSFILWTLVTVAVESARQRGFNWLGLAKTLQGVFLNPIIVGIVLGAVWGFTGWKLPELASVPLGWISQAAGPLALLSLGMSLATYGGGHEWKITSSMTAFKLLVHPVAVWGLAVMMGLPALETRVVVLLASTAIGSNVYLMSRQFQALEKPISQALLLSTIASTVTTPLLLGLASG